MVTLLWSIVMLLWSDIPSWSSFVGLKLDWIGGHWIRKIVICVWISAPLDLVFLSAQLNFSVGVWFGSLIVLQNWNIICGWLGIHISPVLVVPFCDLNHLFKFIILNNCTSHICLFRFVTQLSWSYLFRQLNWIFQTSVFSALAGNSQLLQILTRKR